MISCHLAAVVRCAAGIALTMLTACATGVDAEQFAVCRTVVALSHPEGTAIALQAVRAAPLAGQGLRIAYTARPPGAAAAEAHTLACGFAGSAFEAGRLDLVAVERDGRPLGVAQLVYLKRFGLRAAAPAAAAEGLPQWPFAAAYLLQQVVNGIALAAIYALLATAYSLIYGLIGRINFAFGHIAVIGAFGAVSGVGAAVALGWRGALPGLAAALCVALALAAGWSLAIGAWVLAPLHARTRASQPVLVATVAVAVSVEEGIRLLQGVREHWIAPTFSAPLGLAAAGSFVATVTPMQIAIALAALAAAAGVLLLLRHSRFGRHWRAFADDPGAAALLGVDPARVLAATFILAGAMAGLAGWILAVYYGNVSAAMGIGLGLKALVAAVVGGIGSVPGAFVGGVAVGLIEALWSAYFDISMRDIVVYAILVVVFVLRPGGLFGLSGPRPRDV